MEPSPTFSRSLTNWLRTSRDSTTARSNSLSGQQVSGVAAPQSRATGRALESPVAGAPTRTPFGGGERAPVVSRENVQSGNAKAVVKHILRVVGRFRRAGADRPVNGGVEAEIVASAAWSRRRERHGADVVGINGSGLRPGHSGDSVQLMHEGRVRRVEIQHNRRTVATFPIDADANERTYASIVDAVLTADPPCTLWAELADLEAAHIAEHQTRVP